MSGDILMKHETVSVSIHWT